MPIYEFYSPDSHKIYSFYARRIMPPEAVPRCPDNSNFHMQRLISHFAVTGRAQEEKAFPTEDPSFNPKQEAAMAQLAHEMEHMSEDNPDPRALGKLMRRMTEIAGQDLPPNLQEMVKRLEKGEDPEMLEQEYADAFENMAPLDQESSEENSIKPKRQSRPTRDPHLYEMNDYLKN